MRGYSNIHQKLRALDAKVELVAMKKQSILLEIDKSAAPVIAVKGPLREWLHELKVSLRVGKLRRKNCDVYYWDKGKIVYRDKAILIVPEELRDAALGSWL